MEQIGFRMVNRPQATVFLTARNDGNSFDVVVVCLSEFPGQLANSQKLLDVSEYLSKTSNSDKNIMEDQFNMRNITVIPILQLTYLVALSDCQILW